MRILTLTLIALFSLSLSAQSVDDELGFIYVLYKRAYAKSNVGAFQGTYNDLLQSFEAVGVTPEAVLLFGKAQNNLGKTKQAAQTMETAGLLYPNGTSAREKAEKQRTDDTAKTDGEGQDPLEAMKDKISSILEDLLPDDENATEDENSGSTKSEPTRTDDSRTDDRNDDQSSDRTSNDRGGANTSIDLGKKEDTAPVELEPEVDNSVREIYIDEDVTLEIKNGLGKRKILQQPNILILSETSGNVVIDLCVNMCGTIVFKITGSN